MDNNVYVLKNYGKVEITLKEVLEKKKLGMNGTIKEMVYLGL